MIRACLNCGATDCLDYVTHEGPTGVIGPDACLEQQTNRAWRCSRCGAIEDDTDWIPSEPEEEFDEPEEFDGWGEGLPSTEE